MTLNLLKNRWKYCLISFLLLFSLGSSIVYGFERAPIYKGKRYIDSASLFFYREDLQTACEYLVYSQKDYYFKNTIAQTWKILNVFPELNTGSYYYCMATALLTLYENTVHERAIKYDSITGASISVVFPVCNIGDPSGSASNETICTIPDNTPDPGANLGKPDCESLVSNPINAATGNKFALETDLELPSGLGFARSYNSNSLSGSAQIGNTWRHTYQRSLYVNPETITATRPDGRLAYFRLSGSTWINQQAGGDALVPATNTNGDPIGWQFITANDTVENYSLEGKLLTLVGRNGRTQTLNYDANGNLVSVSDDVGLALSFTYDGSNRIASMTDPAGGLYQ